MRNAFEWDKEKAEQNLAKHGVSFDWARRVFNDPFAVEWLDDRENYGEDRFVILGAVEGIIFFAVYAERQERIRLISARYATRQEQDEYFRQNA